MHVVPKPRMKRRAPLLRGGGELHVVGHRDVVTLADPDGALHRLAELADGSRSAGDLHGALAADFPGWGRDDVLDAVARLDDAGLLDEASPGLR